MIRNGGAAAPRRGGMRRKCCSLQRVHGKALNVRAQLSSATAADAPAMQRGLPEPPKQSTLFTVGKYFVQVAMLEGGPVVPSVAVAATCMLLSKATGLGVPFLFRQTVESLEASYVKDAIWLLVAGGLLKGLSALLSEVRSVLFLPAAQRIARRVELGTFEHLCASAAVLRLPAHFPPFPFLLLLLNHEH